uniref:VCBS repeat-containing protein n=1 Tax=Timema shepardi TaxID=629360 RepID=A0A7R9FWT9_TIMSH|nr:unnamed protein product [Timema shepardi]
MDWIVVGQNDVLPTKLGQFALGEVGFVHVCEDELYLSNFNPLALLQADYIYYISSPGSQLSSVNSWEVEKIDQNNYWPNDLTCTSSSIIGREAIIWPSGFLVPGKTHGKLNVYFTDKEPFDGPYNIASEDESEEDLERKLTKWAGAMERYGLGMNMEKIKMMKVAGNTNSANKVTINGKKLEKLMSRFCPSGTAGAVINYLYVCCDIDRPLGDQIVGRVPDRAWPVDFDIPIQEYSYHHVEWVDVNKDGHTDAITARFTSPLIGSREKEFLWLENPGTGEAEGWTQHIVVSDATDVYFKVLNLEAGGKTYQVVISSEFFNKQLTLRYAESGNMWTDPSVIKTVVIDDSIGESWGIEVTDINNDQNLEIVISSYDGSVGSVYAYEIPSDFRGKPYILVAGDDNGKHYILSPTSNDADDWSYENNLLQDTSAATTGSAIAKDLDGDGYSEIVAAGYSAGQVYVFSYTPQ